MALVLRVRRRRRNSPERRFLRRHVARVTRKHVLGHCLGSGLVWEITRDMADPSGHSGLRIRARSGLATARGGTDSPVSRELAVLASIWLELWYWRLHAMLQSYSSARVGLQQSGGHGGGVAAELSGSGLPACRDHAVPTPIRAGICTRSISAARGNYPWALIGTTASGTGPPLWRGGAAKQWRGILTRAEREEKGKGVRRDCYPLVKL